MWKNIGSLGLSFQRHAQEFRKLWNIHENLQMYVDEQVWRTEHSHIEAKRSALALAFNHEHWKEENSEDSENLGIGGGYG